MKKFDGILMCTDLDGTLLNSKSVVSCENLEAIEYFKSRGGRFTFITGRMPYYVSEIYGTVKPNAPIGCMNGGAIYDFDAGEYVWTQAIPFEVVELAKYADENISGLGIQATCFDKTWFCRENSAMERFRRVTSLENFVCSFEELRPPLAKIIFGDEDTEKMRRLASLLSSHPLAARFDFIASEPTLYEILPKNTNKGNLLPRLAAHLGIDMSKTIALGDYNNDVEMLRRARLGIAVSNACEEAKAAADMITVSNDEHAIAKTVYDLDTGVLSC